MDKLELRVSRAPTILRKKKSNKSKRRHGQDRIQKLPYTRLNGEAQPNVEETDRAAEEKAGTDRERKGRTGETKSKKRRAEEIELIRQRALARLALPRQDRRSCYDDALSEPAYDTVIYFMEMHLIVLHLGENLHIIAIDYRGFGDSESTPSEHGLRLDALATLDWLNKRNVPNNRISLIGHSLGTGVATTLAHDMNASGKV
ncbi:hypothetical protein BD560DRAFT_451890 [Blakeslea trispora]|nr:hypothetical protein BD560DRAFT_451890 [Blakeslea trispora]